MAYRVLIAQFMHETNTFSKLPTTLDDYRKRWLIEGEAMVTRFKGTKNEVGGYIDSIAKYGWQPVWGAAANATVKMASNANALVSYRTYPHVDGYERAVQAAALCQAAMEGKKKPRCLLVQPAMLEGADHGRTTQPGQMRDLLAKADGFETE